MTHTPGRETGHLSTATLAQYRARLRKLWRVYPHITDEEEKALCLKEMHKLCDKTGLELGGPTLMRGPGRPRTRVNLSEDLLARVPEKLYDTSPEAQALKEQESADKLQDLLKAVEEETDLNVSQNNDPKWKPGTPEFIERERKITERARMAKEKGGDNNEL